MISGDDIEAFRDISGDWPYYKMYAGSCSVCGLHFDGPKKATTCWNCTSPCAKRWWVDKNTEKK